MHPTVWLDGARPANICILPTFPRIRYYITAHQYPRQKSAEKRYVRQKTVTLIYPEPTKLCFCSKTTYLIAFQVPDQLDLRLRSPPLFSPRRHARFESALPLKESDRHESGKTFVMILSEKVDKKRYCCETTPNTSLIGF